MTTILHDPKFKVTARKYLKLDFNEEYQMYRLLENTKTIGSILPDSWEAAHALANNDKKLMELAGIQNLNNCSLSWFCSYNPTNPIRIEEYGPELVNNMPPGVYAVKKVAFDLLGFAPIKIKSDDYIDLNNDTVNAVKTDIENFYKSRSEYTDLGLRWKGAALLYGPPGTGKTTQIINIISSIGIKDLYVFYLSDDVSFSKLAEFREYFKDKKTLFIVEEITERLRTDTTAGILNFMDGYESWEGSYTLATTNYPEQLPQNMVDRPGRFNILAEFKLPCDKMKLKYFVSKGVDLVEATNILPKLKDMGLDYMSQLFIQSKLHKVSLSEYIETLEQTKKKVKSQFKAGGKMGL